MPYINIKITKEGATAEQKARLIERSDATARRGATGKIRQQQSSSSTKSTPTTGGYAGETVTQRHKAGK